MKILTSYEIDTRRENELKALFGKLSKDLVSTKRNTPERRNTLASLETVRQKMAMVHAQGLKM